MTNFKYAMRKDEFKMGYTMGCPCKKLNNLPSGGGRKGAANAKAFILEPFKERNCIDDDFDPTKTADNIYYDADGKICDPIAGMDILKGWNTNAENHKGKSKDGKMSRGCRKDAVIGGMTIIKPSLAFMDSLGSDDARNLFMERVVKYVYEEFAKNNGVVIDAVVVHMDEENPHPHIAFHDPDMSLGKKIGLKMFNELNVDFPEYMRDTYGYDLEPCRRFDPDVAAQMTDEELIEYKAQIKKDKKQAGKDSNKYKRDREIQKAKEEAEKILADARAEQQQLISQITELEAERDDLKAELDDVRNEAQKVRDETVKYLEKTKAELNAEFNDDGFARRVLKLIEKKGSPKLNEAVNNYKARQQQRDANSADALKEFFKREAGTLQPVKRSDEDMPS